MQSRINMSQEVKKSSSQSSRIIKHSIGIDVSKNKFEACYKTYDMEQHAVIKGSRSFDNTPSGFKHLTEWCSKRKSDIRQVFTMEATGVYYENLAFYLFDHGFHVSVVLPNRSKKYFQGLGIKTKTDKTDASGLAQMGAEQALPLWKRPDNRTISLRQSTRQREQLQQARTALLNQKEALLHSGMLNKQLINNLDEVIETIGKSLKSLEGQIDDILETVPLTKAKVENICKIKGVGKLTVAIILAETNCFEDFHSSSQLVSYAGYDVVENQSGKHNGPTKISKRGNAHIRRTMHLPALTIKRRGGDPVLTALWDRVYDRTKKKMKAYVAVQRKLLLLIYTLWKKDAEYIPGYEKSPAQRQG